MRSLNVLLPTLGSLGDVHPFIALGLALKRRGHSATVLTNPMMQAVVERQGLGFMAVGSAQQAHAAIANPDVWDLRKGFPILAQVIVPAMGEIYRLIERHADANTVVAFSTLAFGARLAQEKLGVPSASVHLQPSVIRSVYGQGVFGSVRLSPQQPRWFKQALFNAADRLLLDRCLQSPLNELRRSLGLAPVARVMHRWLHSPQSVIALFPDWFATPQADWPPHTHAVGFSLWDAQGEAEDLASTEEFLSQGEPPLVFTAGSAALNRQSFFKESIEVARALRMRAMLVSNFPEQMPVLRSASIKVFRYVPFSSVLPRSAALVHHGGIGTTAEAIKAGIPQLIVPHGYDQFDNGWRIAQLGLGRAMNRRKYRASHAASAIRKLLQDPGGAAQRREYRSRIDSAAAVAHACESIEALGATR